LLAGTNAALQAQQREPWWPRRDEAYLGVLVDDLVTQGTLEPYRMFTSRAEYRLLLREDNADLRLTPIGRELGLVDDTRFNAFTAKRESLESESARLRALTLHPSAEQARHFDEHDEKPPSREFKAWDLLRRPGMTYARLLSLPGSGTPVTDPAVAEQVEVQARYSGYIDRQQAEIDRQRRNDTLTVPEHIDYDALTGLSSEVRQKLARIRPSTIGQAARIPGVTPAAVSILLVHIKRGTSRHTA
jgi:tRNA uridine 5-carboxymethylaminomethyl modification enzyme